MFASRMSLGAHKSPLQLLQAIPNYLATFDSRVAASVLTTTGPDVPATAGQTVARWNSVDNAAVYFTQSSAGIRPTLSANGGIGNTTSGQSLTGTGFTGLSTNRTVLFVFRNYDIGVGAAGICNTSNGTFTTSVVANQANFRLQSGFGGGATNVDRAVAYTTPNVDNFALARKSGTQMNGITNHTRTFSGDSFSSAAGAAGLILFSSSTVKIHLVGVVAFDRAVSDSEAQTIMDAAMLYFGENTQQQIAAVYDIWGQSNASGYASTSGVTAYDGINPERCFMMTDVTLAKYDFGVNHNLGGDGTVSQFGAESEILRLAERSNSVAVAVKNAVTSTGLTSEWHPTTPGFLYTQAMARAAMVRSVLRGRGLQIIPKGLLWAQGERDATTAVATSGATYESLLTTLISNYRAAFGASIPVAIVRIKVTNSGYANLAVIQAAQAAVAANVANVTLIDTTSDVNFPLFDGVHFDPTAQINIGAAAYSIFNQ